MFDAVTYGAAVGAAKKYTDEQIGSDDAVKYTEQDLTSEQQAQARENIGAAASTDIPTDAVKYTAQTLTDAQKTQARTNIGAGTSSFSGSYGDLTNAPPLVKGSGTGGNLNGGTGMNSTTTTAKKNSIAYGDVAIANGNYSAAFGNFVQALHDYEIAFGKLNQSNADTVLSIGDGADTQNRHNLMELKADGTLLLNGNAVKTEGGDDDNKLRLGQIWGMKFSSDSSTAHAPAYGFNSLFPSVSSITFQSNESDINSNADVYQFGDFVGYISSNAVIVRPLQGKIDYPTTGQWIKVENCYNMFLECVNVASLDLSMFDTSEVVNMRTMFCSSALTTLDLSNFDTSEVVNMRSMFLYCTAVSSLNLSMFDTNKVKSMLAMFRGCSSLKDLDISSFDMTNVIEYTDMFANDTALTTLKCPKINPHDDIPLPITLYSQDGTAYTNLPVTTGTSIELRQSWT